jgi:hypothetical protein
MAKDLFPEIEDGNPDNGSRGSSRRFLLLALLLLVMVFGYLYFFTGLIKSREEAVKAPSGPSNQIRHPLPPRPDLEGERPAATGKTGEQQPAQANAKKSLPPPKTAPETKPAAVTTQQAPVKIVKGEEKLVHTEQAKASPIPMPSAGRQRKTELNRVAKTTTESKKAPEPNRTARQQAKHVERQGAFTLLIGEFALDRDMKSCRTRLKKLGITPIQGMKVEKLENMHRLFLMDFDTHYAAEIQLKKLRKVSASAFILGQNRHYALYAGSFLHQKGAILEQKRLAEKRIKLDMQTAKVKIPYNRMTAGSYASSADAQKVASRLRKQGIIAKVIKTVKITPHHMNPKA